MTAALNRLIEPERQARSLRKIDPRGAWMQSEGGRTTTPLASRSAGVAALRALIEEDAGQREILRTADNPHQRWPGLARYRSVKKIVMTDASGAEVVMEYANDVSQ
ncbi:hypothetical protein ACPA9J_10370 [Pseudomonas aeruginosa]